MEIYSVQEIVVYDVPADSAQEAINIVINDKGRDKYCASVEERCVVNGPPGWEAEDYESP